MLAFRRGSNWQAAIPGSLSWNLHFRPPRTRRVWNGLRGS